MDPQWFELEEFVKLIHKWWLSWEIKPGNFAQQRHEKMKFLLRKIKGWSQNDYRKTKQRALQTLHRLEFIQEIRDLNREEQEEWHHNNNILEDLLLEEEIYWKHRAKRNG
jgi:hypothetical protein